MNQIQIQTQTNNQITFNNEQVNVIKNQIAIGATDLELKSFIYQCERTGLDPFSRQIYFIKSGGKVQIQTSIDGFRVIAERSDKYEGQTEAQFCGKDGVWKNIWSSSEFPVAARVGVYKKGFREPLYATAHWNEYFSTPGFMHKKMPSLMLAKVAESLALRKAFPNEMSGLYTQDEMPQSAEPKKVNAIVNASTKEVLPKQASQSFDNGNPSIPNDWEAQYSKPPVNHEFDQMHYETEPLDTSFPTESQEYNPNYVCGFGKKYMGQTLEQIGANNAKSYIGYLVKNSKDSGKPIEGKAFEFMVEAQKYIDATEFKS